MLTHEAYPISLPKPTLLNIYDTHYLPLQASLRPITKSFILALLPGLEEETGEFFEKVCMFLYRNPILELRLGSWPA